MVDGVIVLGLAGGIGAGKSHVARALADMGAIVFDSDAEAKAMLNEPAVHNVLVSWWGAGVLDGDGRVDRAKVAAIVFADPAQRVRLEGLVHPRLKRSRAEVFRTAAAHGAGVAVIDAPLLFEAGLAAECDAVVFVDTPREERVSRVCASRGWDEAELARREAAQMSVEEKRARSGFVVDGRLGTEAMRARLAEIID
ncbi:MAG: dephospho-CoA kinase, partial [Phycisphaerales bacterium]|nr:dephospho-CoA kinase [Phycisphaerales bacterium]